MVLAGGDSASSGSDVTVFGCGELGFAEGGDVLTLLFNDGDVLLLRDIALPEGETTFNCGESDFFNKPLLFGLCNLLGGDTDLFNGESTLLMGDKGLLALGGDLFKGDPGLL